MTRLLRPLGRPSLEGSAHLDRNAVVYQCLRINSTELDQPSVRLAFELARVKTPAEAVAFGHRLAAIVVSHRGAIVPRDATAALLAVLG